MSDTERALVNIHRKLASAAGAVSGMIACRRLSPTTLALVTQRTREAAAELEALKPPLAGG